MANSKMMTTVSSETSKTLSLSNQCDNVIENTNSIENEDSVMKNTNSTGNEDSVMKNTNSTGNEDYIIGDIVWAKIGRYPYWPSIVCIDPGSNTFMKGSPKDKKFSLHVRFYNDNGRRSWAKTIEKYHGKEEILKKYPNCLSFMKNNKKQMDAWHLAVREADKWFKVDRNERMSQFCIANNIKTLTPILKMESSPTTHVKKKAKAKEIQYEISEKLAFVLRPVKGETKKKKNGPRKQKKTSIDHVVLANNSHSDDSEFEPPLVPFDPRRSVPADIKARISLLEINTKKVKPSSSKLLGIKTRKLKPSSSKLLGIKTKKLKPSSSSPK